jgi:hypothetical protein
LHGLEELAVLRSSVYVEAIAVGVDEKLAVIAIDLPSMMICGVVES